MTSVLLDTHVLHWWASEPRRLSRPATRAVEGADELVVSAITWYELAWLAEHQRIALSVPLRTWLDELDARIRTVAINPAIAATAVGLAATFPGDPADRLIFATAIEHGYPLVTKDTRLRRHPHPRSPAIW